MMLSEHYGTFPSKTLLVLTNNELAKFFTLLDHEIEPLSVLETAEPAPDTDVVSSGDLDHAKQVRRNELYRLLNLELKRIVAAETIIDIILCVPEANKNELFTALTPNLADSIKTIVPKNLASMELAQVVRILFET
ncbi:TPA: hypothetical protein DEP96_01260 [Candidatus Uhrbacteria bacterium]|nr:hypothetical protein [Candidatus Uhrbacteria bacterium]